MTCPGGCASAYPPYRSLFKLCVDTSGHQCWVNDRAVSTIYCNIYASALSRAKSAVFRLH